jgi:hypothetical protein
LTESDDLEGHNITLRLNATVKQIDSDLICAESFYLDNSTLPACIPHCQSWLKVTTTDIIVYICLMILGVIFSIILFIVAWLQKDTVWVPWQLISTKYFYA